VGPNSSVCRSEEQSAKERQKRARSISAGKKTHLVEERTIFSTLAALREDLLASLQSVKGEKVARFRIGGKRRKI